MTTVDTSIMKLPLSQAKTALTTRPLSACMHASRGESVNIHIDKICITAPCTHDPIGRRVLYEDEALGNVDVATLRKELPLQEGGEKAYVHSKDINNGKASFIEIRCCPPLVLQKHNLFGHGVLQDYVYAILDCVTKRFGIEVDQFDREEWKRGGVNITEIHLTANFKCPRSAVLPIIEAIDQNTIEGKHRPIPTISSLGFSEKRRSNYHVLTIYDKYLELLKRFKKPGKYQQLLIDEARDAIRAELKLYSQGLKYLGLDYVMRWKDVDLAEIFFSHLKKYKIRYSIQRMLTEDELAVLSLTERNIYLAWLGGREVKDMFRSRTSVYKYTQSVLAKTGIDMSGRKRPEKLPDIDLDDIFHPKNVLPVPEWLRRTPYFWRPIKHARGISEVPVVVDKNDTNEIEDGGVKHSAANCVTQKRKARGISEVPVDPLDDGPDFWVVPEWQLDAHSQARMGQKVQYPNPYLTQDELNKLA